MTSHTIFNELLNVFYLHRTNNLGDMISSYPKKKKSYYVYIKLFLKIEQRSRQFFLGHIR